MGVADFRSRIRFWSDSYAHFVLDRLMIGKLLAAVSIALCALIVYVAMQEYQGKNVWILLAQEAEAGR